jgi:predicted DNA binding CopG/RHH family protein
MTELEPARKAGEIATYEEDPFELGEIDEQQIVIVRDFLPPPEELVLKEPQTEKITIALSKDTLTFFREKAQELGAPYQRMIRNLLDAYVAQHRDR